MVSKYINSHLRNLILKENLPLTKQSLLIKEALESKDPVMIGRFGSTEIKAILFPYLPIVFKKLFKNQIISNIYNLSGFFPSTESNIKKFSNMMIEDMEFLDILGSWRFEEFFLKNHFQHAHIINLTSLEPYFSNVPWSIALENKNILVVHPFSKTIEKQYTTKRDLLFDDPRVLPQFKTLQTFKAIQSIAGNKSEFVDWFEALEYMKTEISKLEFDIAIIGCGAYGFPLAAHVKRIGKKAVHMGGATQMLFGIKGKRWVENNKFDKIINNYFVFPDTEEQVLNSSKVENGCYW